MYKIKFSIFFIICISIFGFSLNNAQNQFSKSNSGNLIPDDSSSYDISGNVRQYNSGNTYKSFSASTIEYVELDSIIHNKKLWLSPKKAITPPPYARHARVIADDSIVFVTFSKLDSNQFTNQYIYSLDYGDTWNSPIFIDSTGSTFHARTALAKKNDTIYMSYERGYDESFRADIIFQKFSINTQTLDSQYILISENSPSEALYRTDILFLEDTLYTSFIFADDTNSNKFMKSFDFGETWSILPDSVMPIGGDKPYLVKTGSVLSVVYAENFAVRGVQSLDYGNTWSSVYNISAVIGFASQRPSASSDGNSHIHVVWYDFQDAPAGWAGWVFYRMSADNGDTWSEIKSLSLYPNAEYVEIFSDTNYVYAVWNDSRLGSEYKAGYLRISHDQGLTWSPEYKIIDDSEHPWEMNIYAEDDRFYMVWKEQDAPEFIHQTYFMYGQWYIPGDVNNSGDVDISDLVSLVNYMFTDGEAPNPIDAGQINGEDAIDISDLVYFINYSFAGGAPPVGGEI